MQTEEISGPEKALQRIIFKTRGVAGKKKKKKKKGITEARVAPQTPSERIQQVNSSTRSATVDLFARLAVMSVLSRLLVIDVRDADNIRGQSGLLELLAATAQCWDCSRGWG
jgi:hypothetical protein